MTIYKGDIITCDSQGNRFQYLVEDKGNIIYTGNKLPDQFSRKGKLIELGEKALLPSFTDGHIHLSNWALFAISMFDVREAENINQLQEIIKNFVNSHSASKAIIAFGVSPHTLNEKRLPIKEELDTVCPEKPLIIIGYDGHSSITNSAMMKRFPERIKKLRGFKTEEGHLFNEAYLEGTDFATSLVPLPVLLDSISRCYDKLAEKGIGCVHAVEGIGFPGDMDVTLISLIARLRARKNGIQTRLFFQTRDHKKVMKRKLPRIGGCFATALDGCFGACDAALHDDYSHQPGNKGILFHEKEEVFRFVKESHNAGLQIQMHAIGDRAVTLALDALETALSEYPRDDHRHTLIHACLINPEDQQRMARLKIGITLQPSFLHSSLEPVEYLNRILGSERVNSSSPLKSLIDQGILISGGSDAPVTHPDPIDGLYACCNHPYDKNQSLDIQQALDLYTRNPAYLLFDEENRGSLEPGKIADMVILNKSPFNLNRENLKELEVKELILKGKPYKPGSGFASLLPYILSTGQETI